MSANAMPFRPGVSGNPGGRPKCSTSRRRPRALLLSYGWGKPPQSMEVSGPNGEPITRIEQIIIDPVDAVTRLAKLVEREAGAETAKRALTMHDQSRIRKGVRPCLTCTTFEERARVH